MSATLLVMLLMGFTSILIVHDVDRSWRKRIERREVRVYDLEARLAAALTELEWLKRQLADMTRPRTQWDGHLLSDLHDHGVDL